MEFFTNSGLLDDRDIKQLEKAIKFATLGIVDTNKFIKFVTFGIVDTTGKKKNSSDKKQKASHRKQKAEKAANRNRTIAGYLREKAANRGRTIAGYLRKELEDALFN